MIATRIGQLQRVTNETSVTVELHLDGRGQATIDTGIGFLDHLWTAFARHSL